MEDSVCHHDKFGYCQRVEKSSLTRKNTHTNCRRFTIDKSCRCGCSCYHLQPDNFGERNKKILSEIKVKQENLENSTKEVIGQLNNILERLVQHTEKK